MLTECVRMLWRRWLLCSIALVLSVAAGAAAFVVIKPMQESRAQVLLVGSVTQPGVNGPTNPLINLGGSLAVVASVVQVVVSDASVAQELYNENATAKYTVAPNLAENAGPTLLITTDDKSGDMSQKTMTAVIDQINQQLVKLQQDRNVQPNLYITTITLTQSAHPLPVRKAQVQKAIMATIGLLVVLLLLILLLERRRMARTGRQVAALQQPRRAEQANSSAEPAKVSRRGRRRAQRADESADQDSSILPGELTTDTRRDPAPHDEAQRDEGQRDEGQGRRRGPGRRDEGQRDEGQGRRRGPDRRDGDRSEGDRRDPAPRDPAARNQAPRDPARR